MRIRHRSLRPELCTTCRLAAYSPFHKEPLAVQIKKFLTLHTSHIFKLIDCNHLRIDVLK